MPRRLSPLLAVLAVLAVAPATIAHAAVPRLAPRIVGGNPAPADGFPSMAALVVPANRPDIDGMFCGGTVIAPYAVLTAAHCIIQAEPTPQVPNPVPVILTPADFVIVTGTNDLSGTAGTHTAVRAIATHPQFVHTVGMISNDIAVVLLKTPTVAPAANRVATAPLSGGAATVYGWGATDAAGTVFPPLLQTASLTIQAPSTCTSFFPTAICAGVTTPSICVGDSGGPLLVQTGASRQLAGVVSGFISLCGVDTSGFTDVALFQSWIDSQLAPTVANVTVSALSPTALHVAWQAVPGGETPTVTVTTSNAPGTPRAVPVGAASLDIVGLPAHTAIGATVHVANAWGSAQATSPSNVTLTGVPGLPVITGPAVTLAAIGAQVFTNGAAVSVQAQYGLDTVHVTTTAVRQLADAATTQRVSFPLTGLLPARTYRVHVVARSAGGTTTSPWLTFTTPAVKPASRSLPKLRGTARVGRTLTCTSGAWRGAPLPRLTYRWRIGTKVSPRFTTSRLRLTTAMRGKKVACVVTARNVAGSVTVRSAAVTVRRR